MSTVLAPPAAPPSSPKTSRKKSAQGISSRKLETQEIYDAYSPTQLAWKNVDWTVAVFLTFVHLGAIAAPFFFSWSGLAAFFLLHWLTASIGVCLGYHRYLAHRSMKLRKPAEFFTMMCGTISGEGTPFMWSATHRLHHNRSDQEGDPHSPLDGSFWSHFLWLFVRHSPEHSERLYKRYIPELLDRPMLKFFERTQGLWLLGTGLLLGGIGLATGGLFGAISMILWGFCLRMVVVYHGTWCVNSATHLWGYKNYKTRDESRNLWWVAILAYGEGWHNNHHAHPSVARAGHKWWEVDLTWWSIRALEMVGQAYDVDRRIPCREQANPTQANEDSE